MCGGAQEGPWSAWAGRRNAGWAMGWTLAIPMCGYTGGWMGMYPVYHPPRYPTPGTTLPHHSPRTSLACTETARTGVLASTKEILGVDNALPGVSLNQPHASPYARLLQSPSWEPGRAVRLLVGLASVLGTSSLSGSPS